MKLTMKPQNKTLKMLAATAVSFICIALFTLSLVLLQADAAFAQEGSCLFDDVDKSFLQEADYTTITGVPESLDAKQDIWLGNFYKRHHYPVKARRAYHKAIEQEVSNGTLNIDVIVAAESRLATMLPEAESNARLQQIQTSYETLINSRYFFCNCSTSIYLGIGCPVFCPRS